MVLKSNAFKVINKIWYNFVNGNMLMTQLKTCKAVKSEIINTFEKPVSICVNSH